jgi:hypothetical protein
MPRTTHQHGLLRTLTVEQHARCINPSAPEGLRNIPQMHPTDVLAELSVLLEEYAPTWYSERLRHRIVAALRLPTEVLVEVCALLEDHAPTWYADRQRLQALGTLRALGLLESEVLTQSEDKTEDKTNVGVPG